MPELINRNKFEAALSEALARIFERAKRNLVNAVYREGFRQGDLANVPSDVMRDLQQDVSRELQQHVPEAFIDTARDFAGLLSFSLDEAQLQEAAQVWMQTWLPKLVSGMMETTSTELRRIAATAPDVPLERRVLLGMLSVAGLFGLARAITIARTTATEVNTAAENAVVSELEPTVKKVRRLWFCKLDERLCPECAPKHETEIKDGDEQPPLHPNCRCEQMYELTYTDGTKVLVKASEMSGKPIAVLN